MSVGPCWSCDAPNSPQFECARGHSWFVCEECDSPKLEPGDFYPGQVGAFVAWEGCHECQEQADHDEKEGRKQADAAEARRNHYRGLPFSEDFKDRS